MFTGDKQTDQMILIVVLIICVVFIVKWWSMCNDIHSIKLILEKKYGKDYKEKFQTTDEQFGVKSEEDKK